MTPGPGDVLVVEGDGGPEGGRSRGTGGQPGRRLLPKKYWVSPTIYTYGDTYICISFYTIHCLFALLKLHNLSLYDDIKINVWKSRKYIVEVVHIDSDIINKS